MISERYQQAMGAMLAHGHAMPMTTRGAPMRATVQNVIEASTQWKR
ncbi:MAG: hypothetical protein R2878_00055 [Thermoleophilia bacterium]